MEISYLFDFDGTLVDSMPSWAEKVLNILRECGVDYPADIINIVTPLGDRGTAEYMRDVLGVPLSLEEIFRQMDEYALPKYRDEIVLKEGVREYLARLRDGGCTLHVLTASPHKMVDPCLKRLGIFGWFDNVWSTDDFGMVKSDTAIYRAAAERIGVDVSEAVFFDTSVNKVVNINTSVFKMTLNRLAFTVFNMVALNSTDLGKTCHNTASVAVSQAPFYFKAVKIFRRHRAVFLKLLAK